MLNTLPEKNTEWKYDDSRNGFVMEASEDIAQGAQVFDSYGEKCNYQFFLNYGFINLNKDGENPDNTFPFSIDLDSEDPNLDVKKELFLGGMKETNL